MMSPFGSSSHEEDTIIMATWGLAILATIPLVFSMAGARRVWQRRGRGVAGSERMECLPESAGTAWTGAPARAAGGCIPAGTTVLIIDDDAEIRSVTEMLLRRRGFEVLTAADGAEGLALFRLRANDIQAILLDLTMPGMSGLEVSRAIRALRPAAPIIFSSGFNEEISLEPLERTPSVTFLQKPYSVDLLMSKIDAAIAARM
jgi:two-component system, cell cycle sensor histidine kinase and response regulator CckA